MADRRGVIIPLIILGFIFFSPDPGRPTVAQLQAQPRVEDVIADERHALGVLQNSSYEVDRFWGNALPDLNLTGLEPDRGYAWEWLDRVQNRVKFHMYHELGSWWKGIVQGAPVPENIQLYHNVTGYVHGKWVRSNIGQDIRVPELNLSSYAPEGPFGNMLPRPFGRNVSGEHGDVKMKFQQPQPLTELGVANITRFIVDMTLQDAATAEEWEVKLHGVYFTDYGQAILTTTSDKFDGFFMLPHLALSKHTFEMARTVVNDSITRTIERQQEGSIGYEPWTSKAEGHTPTPYELPQCELIVYLLQHEPVAHEPEPSLRVLSFLEQELRFPTGAIMPPAPEVRFSMVAFSPDCGYAIESQGPPEHIPQQGNHLVGLKVEVLYRNGRRHLLFFTLTLALQLYLFMRQMREASTPSTRSRISFYTIALLSLGDGFTTMTFLLVSLFVAGLWVNLIGTAFLAFISVSFFAMRFMMDIWAVQAPERARRAREEAEEERERLERIRAALNRIRAERLEREAAAQSAPTNNDQPAATPQPPPSTSPPASNDPPAATTESVGAEPTLPPAPIPAPPGALPLPVTVQRPTDTGATPVFMPSDQDGLQPIAGPMTTDQPTITVELNTTSFGSMYARFYLLLLAVLFVSLNAASWPEAVRRVFFTMLALLYLSFWIPQILRNVQRNCRRALNWEFVMGQSVLRLVPFAYFYGYTHNVLFSKSDLTSLAIMALWLWIQVVILGSQELVGPRWFIRKDWAPPAYDYHPVLREDEEGATMPIGFSQATSGSTPTSPVLERRGSSLSTSRGSIAKETKEKGKRVFDCAICMQELEVLVIEAGGSSEASLAGGLLARRNYMVTPCRHIFHSACLEGWMKYRLQCPICRDTLPPL